MSSKVFLLLGLLLAIGLVISSEVEARDLAEASTNHKKVAEGKDTVEDSTNGESVAHPDQGGGGGGGGGYGCPYGRYCCGWYGYGCGRWCCRYPGQPLDHDGDDDAKQTDHDQAKPGN